MLSSPECLEAKITTGNLVVSSPHIFADFRNSSGVGNSVGNLQDMRGVLPKSNLDSKASRSNSAGRPTKTPQESVQAVERSVSSIMLVRNRMLYAKASHTATGSVRYGFKHIRKTSSKVCKLEY